MTIRDNARFATTRWSLVQAAGGDDQSLTEEETRAALAELCRTYWFPVYAHARRKGVGVEEAEDLAQEFFARVLDGNLLQTACQDRGRFRTFLLTALDHFLANEYKKGQAIKRGGGVVHVSMNVPHAEERLRLESRQAGTPEAEFENRWARVLLGVVYTKLREEQNDAERQELFDELRDHLPGTSDVPYGVVAERLKMSEGAVKVAVHRFRKRFGQLLRQEIAQTVASIDEVDDEIRRLQSALSRA